MGTDSLIATLEIAEGVVDEYLHTCRGKPNISNLKAYIKRELKKLKR